MKLVDLVESIPVKQKSVPPEGIGAFPESSYSDSWKEVPQQGEVSSAVEIWELLAQAGFGFEERQWLVSSGPCHFPREIAEQIEIRASLFSAYLGLTEEIIDEKYGGPPTKVLGFPYRDRKDCHGATIVRFDDILTPEGKLLMSEPEGWSSGQGQIAVLSEIYRLRSGKYDLSSPFVGIEAAAANVLKNTFGGDVKIGVVVPEIKEESGWEFIAKDFELFAERCQRLGSDIHVEKPSSLTVTPHGVSGKEGDYDVLYPFFPPSGFIDEKVTLGKGAKILEAWANGNLELFPEPSWLPTKEVMTAVSDPELKDAYKAKITETEPSPADSLGFIEFYYQMFQTRLFPWSWPLNSVKPPVLSTGEQMSWDEFLSAENLQKGWVFRPLLGTECAGLVFSDEMSLEELKQFAEKKLASFKPGEPYPLQPRSASRELREGVTFENDYRSYFVQPKISHEQFAVRYLNSKKTGLRTRKGFNSRICSTVFIDKSGNAVVGDCDVTLRQDKRVHGATNSVVTIATFEKS